MFLPIVKIVYLVFACCTGLGAMIIAHDAIWDDIAHEAIGWQITFAMILLVGSVVIGALWPIGCAILTCMAIYRHPEWERQFASPARDTQTDPDTLR